MPARNIQSNKAPAAEPSRRHALRNALLFVLVLVLVSAGLYGLRSLLIHSQKPSSVNASATTQQKLAAQPQPAQTNPSPCTDAATAKYIVVDISDRHLWACQYAATALDSPVITGMERYAADRTPPGTYKVYAKYTEHRLIGRDATGSWNELAHYWMPFLHNQYGNYGFHDATWRADSEFGNVDPNSTNASHGCVEMPLAAQKWLFEWAPVGTAVTVKA